MVIGFLWSTVKYLLGVIYAFFAPGLTHLDGFISTTLGAWTGIFIFVYGGEWIKHKLGKYFHVKVFSKTTRRIVKIRKKGGLIGIAALTPIFLSIPFGCLFAVAFENNKKKILVHMYISVIVWGLLFFGLKALFNLDLTKYIRL